jgi:hypothetical protein
MFLVDLHPYTPQPLFIGFVKLRCGWMLMRLLLLCSSDSTNTLIEARIKGR